MRIIILLLCVFLGVLTDPYSLLLPPGFPTPYIPENNQLTHSRVELGKKLFSFHRWQKKKHWN